jgi:hypothetical protein
MATENRRVLEVYSNGGHTLEGVYELTERAAADNYVADLAAGCGVRAKVLEVGRAGLVTKRQDVEHAWQTTPYPPGWYVVHQPGQVLALAVYGAELALEAAKKQHELSVEHGCDIDVSVHIHPTRPKVGEAFRPLASVEPDPDVMRQMARKVSQITTEGRPVVLRRSYELLWKDAASSGEAGDIASTVADVRRALATGPKAKVRLSVGTQEFGESVLGQLSEVERGRVQLVVGTGCCCDGTQTYCPEHGEFPAESEQ